VHSESYAYPSPPRRSSFRAMKSTSMLAALEWQIDGLIKTSRTSSSNSIRKSQPKICVRKGFATMLMEDLIGPRPLDPKTVLLGINLPLTFGHHLHSIIRSSNY
jgi:hypothetical protein